MSSKLGLILSMFFVLLFFSFGIDLISIQLIYNGLDSKSIAISYEISELGKIDQEVKTHIETTYQVNFTCTNNCTPMFGDVVTYVLSQQYQPLVVKSDLMTISIERNAVIGYLN